MTSAGSVLDRIEVPAREGRAVVVTAGQRVRVVDVEGQQVGDVFAVSSDDPTEYHSAAHTRAHVSRLFPAVGERFVTNRRRPVLTLVDDSSPGRHDMLVAACDPPRYAALGAPPGHASCAENLEKALGSLGLSLPVVPQPINVFMDIRVDDAGALVWRTSPSRPGDSVTFRAEMDCVVAVSACPQDLVGINGPVLTPLTVLVLDAPAEPSDTTPRTDPTRTDPTRTERNR
ncbi:urea carboxylase-associated family protein [Streptomyces sp. B6B3]|uniref:urea carboxylase-associated family protein n=1 Tax=Streptomyces sp. B6B3 TaxID=3153570 RepID=UPI00325EA9D6